MRHARPIAALLLLVLSGCGDGSEAEKAAKDAAKRERDKTLLVLNYPKSSGALPRTIEVTYDGARDRTTMTLKLEGPRISGAPATSATLFLTSSHKGQGRKDDNPEGSADGSLIVQTGSPGILAYSGSPGSISVGGQQTPLKEASGKERYISGKSGREEVRFRIPTEALVQAAAADSFTLTLGTIRLELSGPQHADFREFVARMNPKP